MQGDQLEQEQNTKQESGKLGHKQAKREENQKNLQKQTATEPAPVSNPTGACLAKTPELQAWPTVC